MKNLIFLALLILAAIVGYTYFFGKGEDKERAENIVNETRDLGRSVGDFLKKQKDKYDNGEFDRLFDRIGNAIDNFRKKPAADQQEAKDELRKLETELKKVEPEKLNEENREELKRLLDELEKELEEAG